MEQLTALKQMASGNPSGLMTQLMRSNPRFAQFVALNAGKSPEQAFKENGLDFSQFKQFL